MNRIPIIWRAVFFTLMFVGMVTWTWVQSGRRAGITAALVGVSFAVLGLVVLFVGRAIARARTGR